ncbi:MAG: GTP-binding protein [Cyanobacteria bacterium J06649_11]
MKEQEIIHIPVTILTGFLGAGKTTFLNHLLEKNQGTRYAIIENEFGEQGVDNELVLRPEETSIVELNNGCLCCTLNDNLYDILNELFDRRSEFDEIIIEGTGVADPTGLAEPFIAHPLIKKHFPLKAIICLVDAELVEDHIVETEEAKNQIAFSDILLINKVDLVSEDYVLGLKNKLQSINPLATIVQGQEGHFPEITYAVDDSKLENLLLGLAKIKPLNPSEESFPVHKPHHHHHHHHTQDINSHTFNFEHPLDFQLLHQQLLVYLTFQATGLYRIKGLICFADKEEQYLLQSVGKRMDFKVQRNWKPGEPKRSTIVFIGKNLQRGGLEKMLNRCIAAPAKG